MKRIVLLAGVIVLAGCGGGSKPAAVATTTTAPAPPKPAGAMRAFVAASKPAFAGGTVKTLYQGTSWSVVQVTKGGRALAEAFELLGNKWKPDTSGNVKVEILGPQPNAKATKLPQVAIQVTSPAPFVETAIWVDGTEVIEKGGAISPTRGTIYGAPAKNLAPGIHVAVGYGRTATTGTAVAWTFHV
jgi:hypothetical protein